MPSPETEQIKYLPAPTDGESSIGLVEGHLTHQHLVQPELPTQYSNDEPSPALVQHPETSNSLSAIMARVNGPGFTPGSASEPRLGDNEHQTRHVSIRPRTAIAVGLIAGLGAGFVASGPTADRADAAIDFVNENKNPELWSTFLEANADGKGPQRVIVVDKPGHIEGIASPETQLARRIGVLHYDKDFVEKKKQAGQPYNGDFYERVVVKGEMTEGQYMAQAVANILTDGEPENMVVIDELRAESKDQLRDFVATMTQIMAKNPNIRPEQIAITIGTGKNKSWSTSKDIIQGALKAGFQINPQVYVDADDWVYAHTFDNDVRDEVIAGQFLGGGFAGNNRDRMVWLLDEAEKMDSKSLISPIIGITGDYANTKIPSQFVDRLMYVYYNHVIPNVGNPKQQAMLKKLGLGTWKADGRTTLSKIKHAVASNDAYAAGRQTPRISRNVVLNSEQSAVIKKARAKIRKKDIDTLNKIKPGAGNNRVRSVINQELKAFSKSR